MQPWSWALVMSACALTGTVVAMPFFRQVGRRWRICDLPGGSPLKIHASAIPTTGGMGILAASTIWGLVGWWTNIGTTDPRMPWIYGAGAICFGLGFWDDIRWKGRANDKPIVKFLAQVLVSLAAGAGLLLAGVRFCFVPWPSVAFVAGAFYVFGGMNALNMQDGIDGLAASLSALSLVGFLALGLWEGNVAAAVLAGCALGAVLGFLLFNFPPARVFMGDSGSHYLGFLVATAALMFTSELWNVSRLVGAVLIIGAPVFDGAWAVGRRALGRKRLFEGDRGHWYDWLMARGWSVRATIGICSLVQVGLVGLGIALVAV